jgi:hypothetical protein
MNSGIRPGLAAAVLTAIALLGPLPAHAQQARINKLSDVAFGTVANFSTDLSNAQSVCLFSSGTGKRYHVTATGSGSSGAFTLASGGNTLGYEVQWSASAGQTSGTAMAAGVALTGLISTATISGCTSGPVTSASLITIIRAANISAATAGSYTGTLTLLVAPN